MALTIPRSYADGDVLTADMLDECLDAVETKFNTTLIQTADIAASAIGTSQLATNAVTNAKMADNSVDTAELVDGAVETSKINDLAVTTGKINDAAVTTAKINDLAVTTGKINDLAVTTGKINDSAVTNVKLNDASVSTAKLGDGCVTTLKLGAASVTQAKMATQISGSANITSYSAGSGETGTVTISCTGTRNVLICVQPQTSQLGEILCANTSAPTRFKAKLDIYVNNVNVTSGVIFDSAAADEVPISSFSFVVTTGMGSISSGNNTFGIGLTKITGTGNADINYMTVTATEL